MGESLKDISYPISHGVNVENIKKRAWAELSQAQPQLWIEIELIKLRAEFQLSYIHRGRYGPSGRGPRAPTFWGLPQIQ